MTTRKILCAVLAMVLCLMLPMCAMAEGEGSNGTGSYTLLISDPVIRTVSNGETTVQDLKGLGLQLGTVMDLGNMLDPAIMHSFMVLVKDNPAISAMYGYQSGEFYALISGIKQLLVMPLEDVMEMAGEQLEGLGMTADGIEAKVEDEMAVVGDFVQLLEKIEFVEGPAEDVEFYNGVGHCARNSASLSNEDLKELLRDVQGLPEDLSLDLSYFMDGTGNVRVEGVAHNMVESAPAESRDIEFVVVAEHLKENAVNVGGYVGNGEGEINFDFNTAPDSVHTDHETVEGVVDVKASGEDVHYQVQVSLSPGEAEDGVVADVFNATLFEGEEAMGALNFVSSKSEEQESFSVYLGDSAGKNAVSATYDGVLTEEGTERDHEGKFTVEYVDGEMYVKGEMGIYVNHSTNVEGKMVDTKGMEKVNVGKMTEAESGKLMTEVQQVAISAVGKLMTLQPVANMLNALLQSGALAF